MYLSNTYLPIKLSMYRQMVTGVRFNVPLATQCQCKRTSRISATVIVRQDYTTKKCSTAFVTLADVVFPATGARAQRFPITSTQEEHRKCCMFLKR